MTREEMFNLLAYAATSQQVEITEATVAVYHDQLGHLDGHQVAAAIRGWVGEYDEPYRRLPTVGELRAIMRRSTNTTPPDVEAGSRLIGAVREARKNGASRQQVEALIEKLSSGLMSEWQNRKA